MYQRPFISVGIIQCPNGIYDIEAEILIFNCFATKVFKSLYLLAGSTALDASYLSSRSKQDLKHFSKFDLLGFAAIVSPYIAFKLMNYLL